MTERLTPPMLEMAELHRNRLRFHMPGHKGKPLPYPLAIDCDLTEIPGTDDLYHPGGAIDRAQAAAAKSAHAGRSIMLTNGSTAGVLTMIMYAAPKGSALLLSRNAHRSAGNACALAGVEPVYVDRQDSHGGLTPTSPSEWIEAMRGRPDAKAALVTSPDYYGMVTPLAGIAAEARRSGMRLLVDQAHGAHWNWWDEPPCAGLSGADMWVQSAHKTLPAPGQTAWLHMKAGEDAERARCILARIQTSSPSYLFMTALDCARAWMDERGTRALERLKDMIPVRWPDGIVDPRSGERDPTRIVLDVAGRGRTGFEAQRRLSELGVDIELADERRIVLIASVADEPGDFDRLTDALNKL
ncbi:MAG: aminotransferase class I/II-fold pyridoxal phosphate-dependent enzyme [Oscillospiraceae bacterium]|jgi:arginine/lysine/ornithine decarboxylase|nr:aminotransferase class I/II-fold pyridoxal phosphate-dependent enzyme [Oscillospiraceae bacterium]